MSHIFPLASFKFCNRFNHIYLALVCFSVAHEEGLSCLTEILGIKFIIFSRPVSLSIVFFTADPDLTKIRLHSAAVCTNGPCITVYTIQLEGYV